LYGISVAGPVRVSILLVGDELLAGHTRDANAYYATRRVAELGHRVRRITTLPDDPRAIHEELDRALRRSEVVIVSGGLGPTHDDRTTEALADHFGRRLVLDNDAWHALVDRYAKRLGNITPDALESAKKMVTVPEGAEVLPNPLGAACGYVLQQAEWRVAVFPGVPREFEALFELFVLRGLPARPPATLIEVSIAMPEAAFARALAQIADRFADVDIGSYPRFGEVTVRLRFRGEAERAQAALDAFLDSAEGARDKLVGDAES